tara:strand:+ start:1928 stop:2272 length:345 start_codon:yes stop_codon:yes gene_type:complete
MQAKTDLVIVRGPDGKPVEFNDVTTLMGNLGLFIKSEDKLEMYVWENVLYLKWTETKARESVWEEALAELIADAFDDDEFDWEEEEPTTPKTPETPSPEQPEDKDDPNIDPYAQ